MNPDELSSWCGEMRPLTARFESGFESRFGFPPDEHLIAGPTEPAALLV